MSDEEYERFEITDYDLENEFNPNRHRRRQTKNQAIYGIWAANSDESDEEKELDRRRKKGYKDYSKPMSFVSGGVQKAGKQQLQLRDKDCDENEDEEESGDDSSFNESESEMSLDRTAGMRINRTNNLPRGVGDWEAHTKGIGSKLLQKMGYEPGKGLGKDLQGISAPVQAFLRKGRGAIGAYGPEKAAKIADEKKPGKKKIDEDEKEEKEFKEKISRWRKDQKGRGRQKVKYVYKTVEDVIAKGQKSGYGTLDQKMSQVTVIDMTGPEKRVLSGYHALSQAKQADEDLYDVRKERPTQNFSLPELTHNLNLLVEMSEQEIISHDRKKRSADVRIQELEREKENLHKIVELEQKYVSTLEDALKVVKSLVTPTEGDITLEEAEQIFIHLKVSYSREFEEFQLQDLVPGIIAPLINAHLRNWNPFVDPTRPIELIKRWMGLLNADPNTCKNMFDPYSALIWSGIVPSIRSTSTNWDPRAHHEMVALLDAWAPLFPEWILDSILDQIVLAKLTACVSEWNPLTDHIPIHIWIHPWIQLLNDKMQTNIYPTIREKLSQALKAWSPEDRSARAMIAPWKGVFTDEDMEVFLNKNIVPKLELRLQQLVINPLQQDLEIFNQAWEWNTILSTNCMVHVLNKNFFPKWMQVLVLWLNQPPNFDQVSRWYQGWKGMFTEEILNQPTIREHFRRALELMSRATNFVTISESEAVQAPTAPNISNNPLPSLLELRLPAPSLDFKELVSQKCAERGIIFAPMPGKRELGKQVYRLGKLFCYIDRQVCIVSQDGGINWNPMSVHEMLEIA